MSLTDVDLAWVRDEIGEGTPPSDTDLDSTYDQLGHRSLVAIRVLKRRRAALAAGGVSSVTIPGAVAVTLRSDLASLDRQITRLEAQYESETGVDLPDGGATSTRLTRTTAR